MPEDLPSDVRVFLADYVWRQAEMRDYPFYAIDQKERFARELLHKLGVKSSNFTDQ